MCNIDVFYFFIKGFWPKTAKKTKKTLNMGVHYIRTYVSKAFYCIFSCIIILITSRIIFTNASYKSSKLSNSINRCSSKERYLKRFRSTHNSICRRGISNSSVHRPVRVYYNAGKDENLIIHDNNNKTGIYRWVNIESGKSYVGSGINLAKRLRKYFNYRHISAVNRSFYIHKALLKYGYAGFRLEILEYCYIEDLIEREQYYIDLLKPEYNMLKIAGSSLGTFFS